MPLLPLGPWVAVIVFLLGCLACSGANSPLGQKYKILSVKNLPSPSLVLTNLDVDDSCAKLFDYCIKVQCDIMNVGPESVTTTVRVHIQQGAKTPSKHVPVTLAAGQKQTLTKQFPEARLFGNTARGGCEIEYQGTTVLCSVKNTGGSGTFKGVASIIKKNGSKKESTFSLEVARNETQVARVLVPVAPRDGLRWECEQSP